MTNVQKEKLQTLAAGISNDYKDWVIVAVAPDDELVWHYTSKTGALGLTVFMQDNLRKELMRDTEDER